MGFPPMLNGKNKHLSSDQSIRCPRCGDSFTDYEVLVKALENSTSAKQCPHCHREMQIKDFILPKELRNRI